MSNLKLLSVFFLFLILPSLGAAQTETSADLFKQGTQFYVAKDYAKAKESFSKALQNDPHNATVLTNLALSEFQLGNKPLAVGLLRKALDSEPELSTAVAGLKFVLSQMQVKEVPHQIETYESLRKNLLQPVPLTAYLILSTLLFFVAGWLLLGYAGARRRALNEETALPRFPTVAVILTLGFVIFTGLLGLKIYDLSVTRGTIIEEKVALQTAPGENQVSILDLFGGMEVVAHTTQGDWVQVTYPGSLTGWIKKSSLLLTR
ncbi:tetratricopeptide repeat protein [Bdellovibrio bacteriovorus]|uniref:tetratricopeptide repeat protein n=1 Tax=Bdellovibrio bacteriovorus TaxID=959 RepID=UPI003AA898F0